MARIFIAFGHHDTRKSFCAAVKNTFIDEAKKNGHQIDLVNLYEEAELKFFDGSPPNDQVLDYRKRLEKCDVMYMISPCYNLRATACLENWIDHVLAPKWFFSFQRIVGNWGYPRPGIMKNKLALMTMTYGGNWFSIQTWFQNIPFRRIKAGVLKLGGMKTIYSRHYEVLPGMSKEKFEKHMKKVRQLARNL